MQIKSGNEEYFYSMFDDGFWYTLTDGYPPQSKDDLMLENDADAEQVWNAIQVLKQYQDACRSSAQNYEE